MPFLITARNRSSLKKQLSKFRIENVLFIDWVFVAMKKKAKISCSGKF